jgi:small multidrug resistance pump
MNAWLCLGIAIVAEVVGTSALTASDGFSKPVPSIVVVIGYALAFYLLSLTLKTIPVGVAYAVWSGVGVALIALIGWLVYGQRLDAPALLGMALIVAGVLVINLFSASARHAGG